MFCGILCTAAVRSETASGPTPPAAWPGADFFASDAVRQIGIEINPPNLERLRQDAREFVRATVTEPGTVYHEVAVHLKGSIGSFRGLEDKPAFTLDFSHFQPGGKFHGLRRIHLNNSVEDPSYCNEMLGSELFRAAGVPAPRVSRAVVTFNDRRLGIYVVKEGFTEDFLACHFNQVGGNLYEPGEGHDVNERLKRNSVQAPVQDRGPLKALSKAALEPDLQQRWQQLEKVLAVDRFISFMALEVMLCHRDGYCLARNNFRVYQDLDTSKVFFFPHGMDQLLGNPDLPWQPQMAGLVAKALLETPQGKQRYADCFRSLFKTLFFPQALTNRVAHLVSQLRTIADDSEFAQLKSQTALVSDRIMQRHRSLERQLNQPPTAPLEFKHGVGRLNGWSKAEEPVIGKMDRTQSQEGLEALYILTRSEASASWRTRALLSRGRYRFEGRTRVAEVKPLSYGLHQGAGLRVSGGVRQSEDVVGSSSWRVLATEFQVDTETSEVEFICELRASAGEAWFDSGSLQVVKVP